MLRKKNIFIAALISAIGMFAACGEKDNDTVPQDYNILIATDWSGKWGEEEQYTEIGEHGNEYVYNRSYYYFMHIHFYGGDSAIYTTTEYRWGDGPYDQPSPQFICEYTWSATYSFDKKTGHINADDGYFFNDSEMRLVNRDSLEIEMHYNHTWKGFSKDKE